MLFSGSFFTSNLINSKVSLFVFLRLVSFHVLQMIKQLSQDEGEKDIGL